MRAVVLGANLSLSSAVANDMPDRDVNLAQELLALARPGDVFLGDQHEREGTQRLPGSTNCPRPGITGHRPDGTKRWKISRAWPT